MQVQKLGAVNQNLNLQLNQYKERLSQCEMDLRTEREALEYSRQSLKHEFQQHELTEKACRDLKQQLSKTEESINLNETAIRLANFLESTPAVCPGNELEFRGMDSDSGQLATLFQEKSKRLAELEQTVIKQEEQYEKDRVDFMDMYHKEQDKHVTFLQEHFPECNLDTLSDDDGEDRDPGISHKRRLSNDLEDKREDMVSKKRTRRGK